MRLLFFLILSGTALFAADPAFHWIIQIHGPQV